MIPDSVFVILVILGLGAIAGYLDYLKQDDLKNKIVDEIQRFGNKTEETQ